MVSAASRITAAPDSLRLVKSELASAGNGVSGGAIPEQDQVPMIEVEQVSRYRWAAQAAKGRRVLDVGRGSAYGRRLLASGGAREVVGVDIPPSALATVAAGMPEWVRPQDGDLEKLELADDAFELVVCFEVLEHFDDPLPVLDELVRVLAPGGLLLVSSPNCGAYQSGDPQHYKFAPVELEAELAARLRHVRLLQQRDYIVSAVMSDTTTALGGGAALEALALCKMAPDTPGREAYTIAMASDAELPELRELAALAGTLAESLSMFEMQTHAIADKDNYINELTERVKERDRLARLLSVAEQRLADVPELQERVVNLEVELQEARSDAAAARQDADQLDRMLIYGRRMLMVVGPLIKPLRRLRHKLRG
jgi:SAM-dependent methyltransferase